MCIWFLMSKISSKFSKKHKVFFYKRKNITQLNIHYYLSVKELCNRRKMNMQRNIQSDIKEPSWVLRYENRESHHVNTHTTAQNTVKQTRNEDLYLIQYVLLKINSNSYSKDNNFITFMKKSYIIFENYEARKIT